MRARTIVVAATLLAWPSFAQAADTQDINVILPLTGGGAFLGKAEQHSL